MRNSASQTFPLYYVEITGRGLRVGSESRSTRHALILRKSSLLLTGFEANRWRKLVRSPVDAKDPIWSEEGVRFGAFWMSGMIVNHCLCSSHLVSVVPSGSLVLKVTTESA